MSTPNYAQRRTQIYRPMTNQTEVIWMIKPSSFDPIEGKITHLLMTFPRQHRQNESKQSTRNMHSSVYESTCTREASIVWSLQTQSLLPSFVWKLIVSKTGSVTCVSSAHNTIPTTPNRAFLINPSPSHIIRDLTRNLLKRNTPPVIVCTYYWLLDQHPICRPWRYTSSQHNGLTSKLFFQKRLSLTHKHTLMCMTTIANTNTGRTICHPQNLLQTNFIAKLNQIVTYMTTPKYAQRHTKLNAPMGNKIKPIQNIKPNYSLISKPTILTRWWHFPDNIEKTQQTKHKKNTFISSWHY